MPTVYRSRDGRFKVRVLGPPREHPPPHAHVEVGAAGVVVVRLASGARPATIWSIEGDVSDRDASEARRIVVAHEAAIRAKWEATHGR